MAGTYQSIVIKLSAAAGILSMLWIVIGVTPVLVQHRILDRLIVEASERIELRDESPKKTLRWLEEQFIREEFHHLTIEDVIRVKGVGDNRVVSYSYEVIRPLFRNISYVLTFSGSS